MSLELVNGFSQNFNGKGIPRVIGTHLQVIRILNPFPTNLLLKGYLDTVIWQGWDRGDLAVINSDVHSFSQAKQYSTEWHDSELHIITWWSPSHSQPGCGWKAGPEFDADMWERRAVHSVQLRLDMSFQLWNSTTDRGRELVDLSSEPSWENMRWFYDRITGALFGDAT